MFDDINLPLILGAGFIAVASPGPAMLAIAGTSMSRGRRRGLALAAGITTGSLIWSVAAAAGIGAVMLANVWLFEVLRYIGAGYLLYLAAQSARSAWVGSTSSELQIVATGSDRSAFFKGMLLHLTNPKAMLFFGALYSVGLPAETPPAALALVIVAVLIQGFLIFHGYALLFSVPVMTATYVRLRRWFDGAFALAFGAAGAKILTAKIES